jgi:hypothetical protein
VAPAESVVPIPSNVAFPGRFHAADERPHSPGRAGPADRARRSDCCGDRIGGGLRRVCGADGQERRAALLDQRELRG